MIWNIGFVEGSCKWRLMAVFLLIGKNILWLINVVDSIISSKLYDKRIEINLLNDVHENLKYNIVNES